MNRTADTVPETDADLASVTKRVVPLWLLLTATAVTLLFLFGNAVTGLVI